MTTQLRLGALTATLALALALTLLGGCATPPAALDYTAYKSARPRSILILPPLNNTPDVNASNSVLSVVTQPLAEAGYYVMPVSLVSETFKQNGVTVADDAQHIPIDKLQHIFGADAALYLTVSRYGNTYRVISSVCEVEVSARLVDLHNGAVLWQGASRARSDENRSSGGGGLIGALVVAAVNQIVNTLADQSHDVAIVASGRLLSAGHPNGLLYGPYHPRYGSD